MDGAWGGRCGKTERREGKETGVEKQSRLSFKNVTSKIKKLRFSKRNG